MFFRVLASLIKDTINFKSYLKLKLIHIDDKKDYIKCENIENGQVIILNFNEVIASKLAFFSPIDIEKIVEYKIDKINQPEKKQPNHSNNKYYYYLTYIFIFVLILSNIAGIKMCNYFGYELTGGIIFFPFTYIITDIVTEVYGLSASRKTIVIGLISTLILNSFLYLVVLLPGTTDNSYINESFNLIFSASPRIFLSSLVSYFFGEWTNSYLLSYLKERFNSKYFVLRAVSSTLIGAFLESIIFCMLVFFYTLTIKEIIFMASTATAIKVFFEILIMPFTLKIVSDLKMQL